MCAECKYTILTDDGRLTVFMELQALAVGGKLPDGAIVKLKDKFNCSYSTVSRIWPRKESEDPEETVRTIRSRRKTVCGRPGVDVKELNGTLRNTPLRRLRTLRGAAEAC